jgi:hypothetical protein
LLLFLIDSNLYFSDELVDQVLNELNITMANQIPCKLFGIKTEIIHLTCYLFVAAQNAALTGRVANPGQGQQAQAISTADADLEARLEALRRN